jgi:hypothetical protein
LPRRGSSGRPGPRWSRRIPLGLSGLDVARSGIVLGHCSVILAAGELFIDRSTFTEDDEYARALFLLDSSRRAETIADLGPRLGPIKQGVFS